MIIYLCGCMIVVGFLIVDEVSLNHQRIGFKIFCVLLSWLTIGMIMTEFNNELEVNNEN